VKNDQRDATEIAHRLRRNDLPEAWIAPPKVRELRELVRFRVGRIVRRVAKTAGLGHVHRHQLRHTLATQVINRGMRLEAIAALLGHRSLRMTLTYARIANRTVAEEYATTQARVDARYNDSDEPADLTRPRHEHRAHARQRLVHPSPVAPTAPSKPSAKAAATTRPPSSSPPP
jgi:hypothetical protein